MNKVKKIGVLAMLLITVNAFAKDGSPKVTGLYKNESDFVSNKLSYQIDCNSKEGSISVDNLFVSSSKIRIKENGKKYTVFKNDFFGYLDCNNNAYRFYGNDMYEIVDISGFYMYKRTYVIPGKGMQRITQYYFSTDGSSALQVLTKQNLEIAFASNTQFRYALENTFRNDSELTVYDNYLKCYKVKYIFNSASAQK